MPARTPALPRRLREAEGLERAGKGDRPALPGRPTSLGLALVSKKCATAKKKKPNLVLPSFALQSSSTTGWGCHQIRSQVSPCSEGFSSLGRWKCGHDSRVMLQGQQRGGGQLEWGKDPCMLRLRPRKAAQCLCARCRNPSSNQGITAARAAWVLNKQKAVSQVPCSQRSRRPSMDRTPSSHQTPS